MRIVASIPAVTLCVYLSGCGAASELPAPGEYPSTVPVITDIIPKVIMPGSSFGVVGQNFDATVGNNTLTIGNINVPVTASTTTSLLATLPIEFESGEYTVSVTVGNQEGKFNGTVKVVSVYVAGWENDPNLLHQVAKYWKNGVEVPLSDGTTDVVPQSIFVDGKDVHVVGNESSDDGASRAIYWKNGVATYLTDNSVESYVHSVYVSGGEVYIGGNYGKDLLGYGIITYWKNGMKQTDIGDGTVPYSSSSMCVSGGDVYILGAFTSPPPNGGDPWVSTYLYWKNGGAPTLLDSDPASLNQIIAVGTDIYVAGAIDLDRKPEYWLNGKGTALPNGPKDPNQVVNFDTQARSVAAAGKDILIAGNRYSSTSLGNYEAGYWNLSTSSFVTLFDPQPNDEAYATSITTSGSDVFVAGHVLHFLSQNGPWVDFIKFWINGQEFKLTDGTKRGGATAIFVK